MSHLDHGSGKVVFNLDSHSFVRYVLCLYPNHVICTSFDVKTLLHLLNRALAGKLQRPYWPSNYQITKTNCVITASVD